MNNYQIQAGDTLGAIAKKQGMSVQNLLAMNPNITDPNKIMAGATLNLATPSVGGNVGASSTPAVGAPAPVVAPAAAAVAPINFATTIPENIPGDALAPTNTPSNLKAYMNTFLPQVMQKQADLQKSIAAPVPQAVTEARQAAVDIGNKISQRTLELKQKLEEVQKNNEGQSAQGNAADVSKFTADANKELESLAVQQKGAAAQLSALLDDYKLSQDNLKTQYAFNSDTMTLFKTISDLTRPDVLKTDVDPMTGDAYAFIQDPFSGEVTKQSLGNVGARKSFVNTGTYQDAAGNDYFYGVNPDGTITTQKLAGVGAGGGLQSTGFASGKVESEVRADVVSMKDAVKAKTLTMDEAYERLRTLYSPSEVSDEALKKLMGIVDAPEVAPTAAPTAGGKRITKKSITNTSTPMANLPAGDFAQDKGVSLLENFLFQ